MREDTLADQADDAADENPGADKERRASGAGRSWFRGFGGFSADLFDSFTGDCSWRSIRDDLGVSCQRAYSFILLRSVL